MTTPTKTAAKATSPKVAEKPEENKESPAERIPATLSENAILGSICKTYLDIFDEITEYNKAVLAEKDSEWNPVKVLEQARKFASPDDASQQDEVIKKALDEFENAAAAAANARKNVLEVTAKKLGITLSATASRDAETEAPLKEKRKTAVEIGTQLHTLAGLTTDKNAKDVVEEFLKNFPMPAVGRDQVRTFGNDEKSTPKYRVKVTVTKDGHQILSEDGFTKAAIKLSQPVFGYERGKALKADKLREVWEAALKNDSNLKETSFEDNGLIYTLTQK